MVRENSAIGVIAVRRVEKRPFTQKQIDLLFTFANQAVIALENVRLFEEVKARNFELTEFARCKYRNQRHPAGNCHVAN